MAQLTQEELQSIKDLQSKYNQTLFEIGLAEAQRIALQDQFEKIESNKKQLVNDLETVEQKEQNLIKSLQEKYGNGSINPETGEIIIQEIYVLVNGLHHKVQLVNQVAWQYSPMLQLEIKLEKIYYLVAETRNT